MKVFAISIGSIIAVVAFAGLFGTSVEYWDGGFPDAVYELTFVDQQGDPIEGIEFQITDEAGRICYHRPINNFYSDSVPTTDHEGLMTFYSHGVRFGGTCHTYFFVIKRGGCSGPHYDYRFLYKGKDVHALPGARVEVVACATAV